MNLIVATSQYLAHVYSTRNRTRIRKLHTGAGVYAGVTWDAERLYALALNNKGWWAGRGGHAPQEHLLAFDSLTPQPQTCENIPSPTRDGHQILWIGPGADTLYTEPDWLRGLVACDCAHDQLVRIDPAAEPRTLRLPRQGFKAMRNDDRHHLNSVFYHPGWGVVVNAMNDHHVDPRRQSALWRVRQNHFEPLLDFIGFSAHNVALVGNEAWACSSQDGYLMSFDMDTGWATRCWPLSTRNQGFPRGLAITDAAAIAGMCARGARRERHYRDAVIRVFDRESGSIVRQIELPKAGQIYVIRAVDPVDWAHHGDWGPAFPLVGV